MNSKEDWRRKRIRKERSLKRKIRKRKRRKVVAVEAILTLKESRSQGRR